MMTPKDEAIITQAALELVDAATKPLREEVERLLRERAQDAMDRQRDIQKLCDKICDLYNYSLMWKPGVTRSNPPTYVEASEVGIAVPLERYNALIAAEASNRALVEALRAAYITLTYLHPTDDPCFCTSCTGAEHARAAISAHEGS